MTPPPPAQEAACSCQLLHSVLGGRPGPNLGGRADSLHVRAPRGRTCPSRLPPRCPRAGRGRSTRAGVGHSPGGVPRAGGALGCPAWGAAPGQPPRPHGVLRRTCGCLTWNGDAQNGSRTPRGGAAANRHTPSRPAGTRAWHHTSRSAHRLVLALQRSSDCSRTLPSPKTCNRVPWSASRRLLGAGRGLAASQRCRWAACGSAECCDCTAECYWVV